MSWTTAGEHTRARVAPDVVGVESRREGPARPTGVVRGLLVAAVLLLSVLALAVVAAAGRGWWLINRRHSNPVSPQMLRASPHDVVRGKHLVNTVLGCPGCHSQRADEVSAQGLVVDVNMEGNPDNFAEGLGRLHAGNLTPGGPLASWSDGEIVRAIREGIRQDGRTLIGMPSRYYRNLSDDDVRAIVAYLRSVPAVPASVPQTSIAPLGWLLGGLGIFEASAQAPIEASLERVSEGPTVAYGNYLLAINDCADCHGELLDGGEPLPGRPFPLGPNLTTLGRQGWTVADFGKAMRTGELPSGRRMAAELMPWPLWSHLQDDELEALGLALLALPERPDREPRLVVRLANLLTDPWLVARGAD